MAVNLNRYAQTLCKCYIVKYQVNGNKSRWIFTRLGVRQAGRGAATVDENRQKT